jgi:hypothetical protein
MSGMNGSVERGGNNRTGDVKLIQQLLNRSRTPGQFLLRVDGVCGLRTIAAIEDFQLKSLRLRLPDGIVQPSGPTMAALSARGIVSHSGQPIGETNDKIAWGAKVSAGFKQKVIRICKDLDVPTDFLMAAMAFESGETFSPSVKNAAGSGAVGLIQFMPGTAKALGTSTDLLAAMSAVNQLDYVKKYFEPRKGKLQTLEDVYMAILYPVAIGTGSDHVLFDKGTKAYTQNKGLDKNKDGKITVGEAAAKVRAKLQKGLGPGFAG